MRVQYCDAWKDHRQPGQLLMFVRAYLLNVRPMQAIHVCLDALGVVPEALSSLVSVKHP